MSENIHYVSLPTIIFVITFLVIYMFMMLKRAVSAKVDLYDFLMLSTVAIVPCAFVLLPGPVLRVTQLIGVQFPFLLLFSALILVIFIFIYSLVRRINQLQHKVNALVQETGLISEELRPKPK